MVAPVVTDRVLVRRTWWTGQHCTVGSFHNLAASCSLDIIIITFLINLMRSHTILFLKWSYTHMFLGHVPTTYSHTDISCQLFLLGAFNVAYSLVCLPSMEEALYSTLRKINTGCGRTHLESHHLESGDKRIMSSRSLLATWQVWGQPVIWKTTSQKQKHPFPSPPIKKI